jgi:hypothetical protein
MIHPPSLSLRVIGLENAICNEGRLICRIFRENKKLNLELESASSKITTLRSMHDDMSDKQCDNCKKIMVNYADLWLVHSHIASLLDGARLLAYSEDCLCLCLRVILFVLLVVMAR